MSIKLDIGIESFPIEFSNGKKAEIHFNPNDPDLAVRLKRFRDNAPKRIAEIEDVEIGNDGKPTIEQGVEAIERFEKIQNIMCEELDKAFGSEISSEVFKYCSPFALVKGERFVVRFMEAMLPEIQKRMEKANEKRADIQKKYLSKYKK